MTNEERLEQHGRFIAEHERIIARIDRLLDRAVRLGVLEARQERRKRRELDEKMTQLAAAQLVTEEKMQSMQAALEAFLKRGGNGQGS